MAKAFRCDRCLEYFSRAIKPEINIVVTPAVLEGGQMVIRGWDLCPSCQKTLEDWMNCKSELSCQEKPEEELMEIEWAEELEAEK